MVPLWFRKWARKVSLGGTPSAPIVQAAPPPTPQQYYDEMDGPGELTTEPSDSENEEVSRSPLHHVVSAIA